MSASRKPDYTIGRFRGKLALIYYDQNGKRHRHSLGTIDPREAERLAPAIYSELVGPTGTSVAELWRAYRIEKAHLAIVNGTMVATWKVLEPRFGKMLGEHVTVADCRAHIKERRALGRAEWTIYTELGHLRNVLSWSAKRGLIAKAPYIELPPQPKPKEDKHFTREELRALFNVRDFPHIRLAAILLYTTAARSAALLSLKWVRCDFVRDRIDLRDPEITRPHKGRAIVPMLRSAKPELLEAQKGALSEYVIEWGGQRIKSIKRGLASAGIAAKLPMKVTPHLLRHSAAVHMAEDGVDMEVIRQFLGHEDINTTRKIYARFSPTYLRTAAAALEFDDEAG